MKNILYAFLITFVFFILILFAVLFLTTSNTYVEYNKNVMDYNLKMQELTKENIIWKYNCENYWSSKFYNCENNFKNITGFYCNGTLICQNEFEVKP